MNGLPEQPSGKCEVAGASGRMRPEALFGQNVPLFLATSCPAAFLNDTSRKPGRPEKSFTVPGGSLFAVALPPLRMICSAITGSLYDFRVTLNSSGTSSTVTYVARSR